MVFFFCREENPLVSNEPHVAAISVVAFHGNLLSAGRWHARLFYLSLGLTTALHLGSAACETQTARSMSASALLASSIMS